MRRLTAESDVLIENFRPGAPEGSGLAPEDLLEANPRPIVLQVSGYDQTGPYRDRPDFGEGAEAMGGLRHLTAEPGRVPVRVGISLGDTLAALHSVIDILVAIEERHRSGLGRLIDVALYEAVFNCMESLLPQVRRLRRRPRPGRQRAARHRAHQHLRLRTWRYALITGHGDSVFKRLMRPDLAANPQLADNAGRVARVAEVDAAIGAWTARNDVAQVLAKLDAASVPAAKVYTVADIATGRAA